MFTVDPTDQSEGATIRVLYVDDDGDMATVAAMLLEEVDERLAVETAASAGDGLERLDESPFDCVVSDYHLSDVDGLEFLESARRDHPGLPFVLFTGDDDESVADAALAAGGSDFVLKESGSEQFVLLAARIELVVERHRVRELLTSVASTPVGEPDENEGSDTRRSEQLTEIASVLDHDVRNLLLVANAGIDLTRRQETLEHLDRTERALDRLATVVDELSRLARES